MGPDGGIRRTTGADEQRDGLRRPLAQKRLKERQHNLDTTHLKHERWLWDLHPDPRIASSSALLTTVSKTKERPSGRSSPDMYFAQPDLRASVYP